LLTCGISWQYEVLQMVQPYYGDGTYTGLGCKNKNRLRTYLNRTASVLRLRYKNVFFCNLLYVKTQGYVAVGI